MSLDGRGESVPEDLRDLRKPYRYNPAHIAYHMMFGWVSPEQHDPDEVVDQHLDDWLEGLANQEDFDQLQRLKVRVDELLEGEDSE